METFQSKIVQKARDAFNSGKTRNVEFRKQQLKNLLRMYNENTQEFVKVLSEDLRKPKQEAIVLELNVLKDDVQYMLDRIDKWTKPEVIPISIVTMFDRSLIYPDPYGVVLVMGAWNYPLQLPMLPVSGAIAAGNCVVVKPSEISPATSSLLADLLPRYLDQDCYQIVCGGIPETTELLKQRFDYIFYTGSTNVGKLVREAANQYLTPTTLELGGKSPVYIDDTVNLDVAVRRIMWGKCINLGQTCVAPDYILCSKDVQAGFVEKAKEVLKEWYGENPQRSPDLCRIINNNHFSRIVEYMKDGKPVVGGYYDATDRWIEPTVLVDVSKESKVMQEEIFGPVLPIVTVSSALEAIHFINSRDSPLALYLFTTNAKLQKTFINGIKCGSMCINDVVVHIGIPGLPFGGVGSSGMGSYHGKASFDSFSHRKSCLIRNYNKIADFIGTSRYPPYSEKKETFLSFMLKERTLPSLRCMGYVLAFGLGVLTLYVSQEVAKKGVSSVWNEKVHAVQNSFSNSFRSS